MKWFNRYYRGDKNWDDLNCPKCNYNQGRSFFESFEQKKCHNCGTNLRIWVVGPFAYTIFEDEAPYIIKKLAEDLEKMDAKTAREQLFVLADLLGGTEKYKNDRNA